MKFRVQMMSSERGWGREYWHEDYNTFEEASLRVKTVNAKNTSARAPDYYEMAEKEILVVEEA